MFNANHTLEGKDEADRNQMLAARRAAERLQQSRPEDDRMVNVHFASAEEFGKLAVGMAYTREFLCPDCGQFLITRLVENCRYPDERRCLVECASGHRYLAHYD